MATTNKVEGINIIICIQVLFSQELEFMKKFSN